MKLTDESLLPFGKYKGTPMEQVPAKYLLDLKGFDYKTEKKEDKIKLVDDYIESILPILQKEVGIISETDNDIDFDIYNQDEC